MDRQLLDLARERAEIAADARDELLRRGARDLVSALAREPPGPRRGPARDLPVPGRTGELERGAGTDTRGEHLAALVRTLGHQYQGAAGAERRQRRDDPFLGLA